jgi:RNA polymerase sigma-32 factor
MARRDTSTPKKPKAPPAGPVVEAVVVEPEVVEPGNGDGDGDVDDDELAALDPRALEDEDDGDGDVVDVGSGGLVKRSAIALPEGEWIQPDGPTAADAAMAEDDHVPASRGGDDLYAAFVREATKLERLSEEEERAFGLRVRDHQDQRAAKKLVVHNLRLAIKMAHQYRRSWTNLMDLVQEASAGMAIAAQRWDPDQGTRFGTYAVYWIRAQLTKFLMTHGRAIHTGNTRAGRKLYFQLPRVRRKLLAEGKEPSIENIAKEVQEDPIEVARIVSRLDGREASLDAQVGPDEDGSTLGEMLTNEEESDPEENTARAEVTKVLSTLMQRFAESLDNERDKAIWTEHLVASEPKSLVELGARFGVSKQRMGQLATRLKRAFRRHVIDELGPQTQLSWLFSQD